MWKNSRGTSSVSICSTQGWWWTWSHLCFPFPRVHPLYSSLFSVPPPPDSHSQSWVSDTASHFWLRRLGCPRVALWSSCLPSGNTPLAFFFFCHHQAHSLPLKMRFRHHFCWASLAVRLPGLGISMNSVSNKSVLVYFQVFPSGAQRQILVLALVAGLGSARLRVCMLSGHLLTEN